MLSSLLCVHAAAFQFYCNPCSKYPKLIAHGVFLLSAADLSARLTLGSWSSRELSQKRFSGSLRLSNMATFERAVMASDPRMERDRNKDSPAAKFTAVNGNSDHSPLRTTSFRPERSSPPDNYHQHPLPRQNGPFDQPLARQQILLAEKRIQSQHPPVALQPASPPHEVPNLGKRKRSSGHRSSSSEQAESSPRNGTVTAGTGIRKDSTQNVQHPFYHANKSNHQRYAVAN